MSLPGIKQTNEAVRDLQEASSLLSAASNAIQESLDALADAELHDAFAHYKRVKDAYEDLDSVRKGVHAKMEVMKNTILPEKMRDAKTTKQTVEIGNVAYTFYLSTRVSASMLDKNGGMQWLRDEGHEGIITETVNASTLSAFAKSLLEESGVELPEDLFKVSTMTQLAVRKA